jgi:methionine-S-sulfoxide reductase
MPAPQDHLEVATFAGGCFWCMESPYDGIKGVKSVTSGYTGGHVKNPTYEQVCTGRTGHAEAVQILFDPKVISYSELLDVFWHNIDPTTKDRQFADEGTQYRTAVFFHSDEQKRLAEESKKKWDASRKFGAPIVTEITKASEFYPAEEYHQGYCRKKPVHYNMYRIGSGRDAYLDRIWGKDRKAHP